MKIGIKGAGQIGGTLARRLIERGGVWTRAGGSSTTCRCTVPTSTRRGCGAGCPRQSGSTRPRFEPQGTRFSIEL